MDETLIIIWQVNRTRPDRLRIARSKNEVVTLIALAMLCFDLPACIGRISELARFDNMFRNLGNLLRQISKARTDIESKVSALIKRASRMMRIIIIKILFCPCRKMRGVIRPEPNKV